jgi:septum formation protein
MHLLLQKKRLGKLHPFHLKSVVWAQTTLLRWKGYTTSKPYQAFFFAMQHPSIILASGSPRRSEILSDLQIPFQAITSDFDEESLPFTTTPEEYVCQLARGKAMAVAQHYPNALIIGADSLVFFQGHPLGKPAHRQQAEEYLQMLCGQWHSVYTGVSVSFQGQTHQQAEEARVLFNALTPPQISTYLDLVEWRDKAGGYTLQKWGSLLVAKVEGCCYNVTGLPMNTLQLLFQRCGCDLWDYLGRAALSSS